MSNVVDIFSGRLYKTSCAVRVESQIWIHRQSAGECATRSPGGDQGGDPTGNPERVEGERHLFGYKDIN